MDDRGVLNKVELEVTELQRLREWIYSDVMEWQKQSMEAMRLQHLSQRYNKLCKKYKYRVIDVVRQDERLMVRLNRRGSRLVAVRELLRETWPDSPRMFWVSQGVPDDGTLTEF